MKHFWECEPNKNTNCIKSSCFINVPPNDCCYYSSDKQFIPDEMTDKAAYVGTKRHRILLNQKRPRTSGIRQTIQLCRDVEYLDAKYDWQKMKDILFEYLKFTTTITKPEEYKTLENLYSMLDDLITMFEGAQPE